ncbi:MAG: protein kinase [Sphingomonadales bacterium]|nr:protein kinase [Sphingomonadales bacterium]
MNQLGRYRIDGRLGEGALADVFRASDPEIGRTVAIKMLKPELAQDPHLNERFVREARAAGALIHPHIATIFDVGETQGSAYIAMELIEGQPLDVVLQSGRMPYERVLTLGRQLASALAYAHRHGVVHRDIKPSNIMLCEDGRTAKLLDFGVARMGEGDHPGTAQQMVRTQVGQLIGTPRYMSPEQALGLPVDHRSDLFSLGIVLYEMVTGKVAFPGAGLATLAIQIAQGKVEPIDRAAADCPPGLRFIIDKLLAKKPEHRFADGDALLAALDREIAATRDVRVAGRGMSLRVKLPLVLALVTALALGACVTATWSRDRQLLEHMAVTSGSSIAAFIANNAAVMAADNAGLAPGEQDWSAVQAFALGASRDPQVRELAIVDDQGIVRAASNPALIGKPYRAARSESLLEVANGARVTAATIAGQDAGLRFVRPIRYAGAQFGLVDMVVRRNELDRATATARASLLALSAIVMLAVLVIGYLSGAMVARPLTRLCKALEDAGKSGFGLRISHARRDEFGAAFDAFNGAAAEIEAQLAHAVPDPSTLLATRVAPSRAAA